VALYLRNILRCRVDAVAAAAGDAVAQAKVASSRGNIRFHRIKTGNRHYRRTVTACAGAQDLLVTVGFSLLFAADGAPPTLVWLPPPLPSTPTLSTPPDRDTVAADADNSGDSAATAAAAAAAAAVDATEDPRIRVLQHTLHLIMSEIK
jgi:hypothetical protein